MDLQLTIAFLLLGVGVLVVVVRPWINLQ